MSEKSLEERQAEMRQRMASGRRREPSGELTTVVGDPVPMAEVPVDFTPTIVQRYKSLEISREDLYILVWSEPMVKVAARLAVSDVAVAKACRRNKIPLPGRGYWA